MRQGHLLAAALFGTSSIGIASCFVVVAAGGGVVPPPCAWRTRTTPKTCLLLLPAQGSRGDSRTPTSGRAQREHRHRLEAKKAKTGQKSGRPSLDDVERLSRGQAAKKRGTGSRGVCHRLNESERKAFDLAKKQGYVVLRGTGYRRERKGSPLLNIYRQFCDAKATACTSVLTGLGADAVDEVEIDFSPLRAPRDSLDCLHKRADSVASELEAVRVEQLEAADGVETGADDDSAGGHDAADGHALGTGGEGAGAEWGGQEEEEEEWTGDPNNRPIWKFPVVSRVYRCDSRKRAKDVAEALSSLR